MELIERENCVLTEQNDMELLYVLKNFPVFMIADSNQKLEDDLRLDMEFEISRNSGMIQIRKLIPAYILYQDSHFQTVHNGIWKLHNEALSRVIAKMNPNAILELGGGTGILEKTYNDGKENPINWTILEPSPDPVEGCRATFVKGFFPDDMKQIEYKKDILIVHANVIEHMYKPIDFIKSLADIMENGSYMVFSQPDNDKLLDKNYTTFMNFEHNYFCGEIYTDFLLNTFGFEIIDKEYFGNGHSIFYTAKKVSNKLNPLSLSNLYEKYKKSFVEYIDFHINMINRWNDVIYHSNRPVFLFGAHITTQYYIAFGLNTDKIISILDNNPSKQGKRVCGTDFSIDSPKILKNIMNPLVILPKGAYSEEIKKDIIKNFNNKTEFLE